MKHTGLRSRAYALAVLEDSINHAEEDEQIGVIYADIDNFKRFNDQHGHDLGDKMLWGLARMLEDVATSEGVVAEYGGGKFLILLLGTSVAATWHHAIAICERATTVRIQSGARELEPLRLTVGVACFPDDGTISAELLEAAELAVMIGKNHGKNCVLCSRHPLWRHTPPY